ncbi:TonB-dependent receptor [Brevundimonas sp. LF-1]|uniref:TonB-dependent receptor domain-containing protein n=1 Tax=Brevundimonas sp. LF-1 TaxID=3126100 RepID=UPI0030E22F8A
MRDIAKRIYGYDPLDWSADALTVQDEKYFAKLDWNINDQHRAVVSYQQTKGSDLRLNNTVTNGAYVSVGLLSSAYQIDQNLTAYKAQLFSDWTDTFSTEFSISRKETENLSNGLGGNDFAAMQVYLDPPIGPNTGVRRSIRFGPERSRHANMLTVDTMQYRLVGNWEAGFGHRLTGGYEREEQDIFNLFVQVANAEYEFASLADFEARKASSVGYTNAASNNKNDGGASFSYALNTLFLQDEWSVSPNLTLTAGLRYDWYTSDDKPKYNKAFYDRFGFGNDTNLDGISILQPRFGFNWPGPHPDRLRRLRSLPGRFAQRLDFELLLEPGQPDGLVPVQVGGQLSVAVRRRLRRLPERFVSDQRRWPEPEPAAQGQGHRERPTGHRQHQPDQPGV